jgi:UTP--glucose-1-phosphate uridylyltransferase
MTASRKVRKAVIPAAGLGTRFLPATKAIPKEMLPIVDVPTIQLVIDEAVRAGISDVIVVNGRHKHSIEDHFDHAYELEHTLRERGNAKLADEMAAIARMVHIHSVRQKQPLGLGHAVLAAREAAGGEACAILLGDDLVDNDRDPAIAQLVRVYEQTGAGAVMIMEVPEGREHMYGIVAGDPVEHGRMRIRDMVEKPKPGTAPSRWAIVGRYVVPPEIWQHLAATKPGAGGEIQLTDGLDKLIADGQLFYGLRASARRFDCGDKLGYLEANIALGLAHPALGPDLRRLLKTYL